MEVKQIKIMPAYQEAEKELRSTQLIRFNKWFTIKYEKQSPPKQKTINGKS